MNDWWLAITTAGSANVSPVSFRRMVLVVTIARRNPAHVVDRPLHGLLVVVPSAAPEREDQRLQQLASRHEQPECVEGVDEAAQRVGRAAFFGLRRDEHPEQHGLYGVGYQHHGDDAEERDQRQRMERRMPREDQRRVPRRP
ncbi:MAG: hypothetical protein ACLU5I_01340 [Alistipes finegoldii]